MKYWITAFLATTLALNSFADNHEPDWAVQIGDGVSQTVHFCKLINGATMDDIAKLDAAGIKWLDKEKLRKSKAETFGLFNKVFKLWVFP